MFAFYVGLSRKNHKFIFRSITKLVTNKQFPRDDIFRILELNSFTEHEIKNSYNRLLNASINESTNQEDLKKGIKSLIEMNPSIINSSIDNIDEKIDHIISNISKKKSDNELIPLTYDDYHHLTKKFGEKIDSRLWPIASSFLLAGTSIGIIIPCMPIIIKILEIPASEYGFVVAAFGLSKLLGNIPAGYLVDHYGRKPIMIGGLSLCAIGIGGIGFSLIPGLGTPWLIGCRLLTGLGVSGFTGGAFMYLSDISTALNRTRTISPAMASFQAGTAFGPALGGVMIESVGITPSYLFVGGMFITIALLNQIFLTETRIPVKSHIIESTTTTSTPNLISNSKPKRKLLSIFTETFQSWNVLLKRNSIKDIVMLNGCYWIALSGTQLTLLPIHMVGPSFNLNASDIGLSFAMMSIVSVISSYQIASFADKYGKIQIILLGSSLVAISMASLPFATTFPQLLAVLAPMSLGSTALSSVTQAHISDLTTLKERSQALALFRTGGDIGLLIGAIFAGIFSDFTSIATTIEVNSAVISVAMLAFGYRSYKYLDKSNKL